MKKLIIPLILGGMFTASAQTVVTHSKLPFDGNKYIGNSVTCSGDKPLIGNAFSYETRVSRSFFLNDYEIYNDLKIHKVSFATQNVLFLPNNGFPVEVNLYVSEGGAYPNGTLKLIGTANTVITKDTSYTIDVPIEATAPAGSEVVMELHYDGENLKDKDGDDTFSNLFIGVNPEGDNAPSWIEAEKCGALNPIDLTQYPDTKNSKYLMSIEGEEEFLGTTNVIGASKISVYPNPVTDTFSINKGKSEDIKAVELFDFTGKKVKSFQNSSENLSVSELPKGGYVVKIQTTSGKVYNQKLIKK